MPLTFDSRPLTYVLDDKGEPEPIDLMASTANMVRFAHFLEHDERRIVRRQQFETGEPACRVEVSTVFLGTDHAWDGGPPVLWETKVFGLPEDEEITRRYRSREAAIVGHNQVVAELRGPVLEYP